MLVIGVVLALAAFGGVILFGSGSGNAQPAPETVGVVAAAADIPLGTALDSTMLVLVDKPVAEATDLYREPAVLLGKVVRRTVNAGVALTPEDFASSGVGNAAQVTSALKPGQVAMAVEIDGLRGVGGFVQDGDYVDLVLATNMGVVLNVPPTEGGTGTDTGLPFTELPEGVIDATTVKVLVQNVQVLAHGASSAPTDGSAPVDPNTGLPISNSQLLVLSLTPQQAEAIRWGQAQPDATLSMLLRAPGDVSEADVTTTGITLRELVDKWGVLPPRPIDVPYP
jgi:Flp pilus assembly protein CpaB